jgi:putative ABC transport system permease protein
MLRNYLTLAVRHLRKNPLYSTLNLFGLSLGVAAVVLIVLYVGHELTFDRWNPQADRVVRVVCDFRYGKTDQGSAMVSSPVGPDCAAALPDVQAFCRIWSLTDHLLRRPGDAQSSFREEEVLRVDSSFFEVFPRPLLAGTARHALNEPRTVALSQRCAAKYFASPGQAIGQTLMIDGEEPCRVTAVFEDFPANTHFRADVLLSLNSWETIMTDPPNWASNFNYHTYLLLRPGVDRAAFERRFAALADRKVAEGCGADSGAPRQDVELCRAELGHTLQDLTAIHLHSDRTYELAANGSIRQVWIIGSIAAFILLIACINFMNLATARSAGRAREVGLRKVLGGQRASLIAQFLSEACLLAALAVAIAVAIAAAALPWYRELTGRALALPWTSAAFWLALGGGTLAVGLLAGSYPAFFLSAFRSLRALQGPAAGGPKGGLRGALVVFQFTVSVALIAATLVVYRQLNFIQNKSLGFDRSQVLIVEDSYALGDQVYALKQELLAHPAVEAATVSGFLPVTSRRSQQSFSKERGFTRESTVHLQRWRVDADYLRTLGMELVRGRAFDAARVTDSAAVIVNETAVRSLGFGDEAVGKHVYLPKPNVEGTLGPEDFRELTIVGVVRDFHWASLREPIAPVALTFDRSVERLSLRYRAAETAAVLAALEASWQRFSPGQALRYHFLDERFAKMYEAERRTAQIAGVFAFLSIAISCLGLFGLAAYSTEQRTKEIGIRKVLGASVAGLTGLLTRDFLRLVLIAVVPAVAIAWWAMRGWLNDFAYRIELSWSVFALAALAAFAIALATVSLLSVRAALMNPVRALRNE